MEISDFQAVNWIPSCKSLSSWKTAALTVAILPCWATPGVLHASQINWGNQPFTTNLTSQDIPLDERYVFELGTFTNGFAPTAENTDQWAAHWQLADRESYDPENSFVSGSYTEADNAPPFVEGAQGYLWGYLDSSDSRGEWILVTDSEWLWPEADTLAFPLSWLFASTNNIIVGNVDSEANIQTARIVDSPRPQLSGSQWQAMFFTESELLDIRISGWSSDPDGDGLTNAMEMAFGYHPREYDLEKMGYEVERVEVGPDESYFEMRVDRLPDRQIDYTVEISSNGTSWQPALPEGTLLVDTLHELHVRDGVALETADLRFIRLTLTVR